jgi:hypothetical protein
VGELEVARSVSVSEVDGPGAMTPVLAKLFAGRMHYGWVVLAVMFPVSRAEWMWVVTAGFDLTD